MKPIITIILTLLLALPILAQDETVETDENLEGTTTYFFIRHAEKERNDATNKDPHLMQKGIFRAAKWSYALDNIKFDAVYSSDYFRTKETAQPTAEKNNLKISLYDSDQLNSQEFIENTKGKTVLVVGHSDTTPMFVNAILGNEKYPQMDDNNNGNLYIVTISKSGDISDVLLVIN